MPLFVVIVVDSRSSSVVSTFGVYTERMEAQSLAAKFNLLYSKRETGFMAHVSEVVSFKDGEKEGLAVNRTSLEDRKADGVNVNRST